MQKGSGTALKSSAAQQTKPQMPKHNMTVIEIQTPHQKLPGVQKYTTEDIKLMIEKAKQFPSVHNGLYLKIQHYDFQVDEWELETGNSQPHSDESKLNMRPKTAVTADQRRIELAKKSQQARQNMYDKLDKERNPTFKRPATAVKKSETKIKSEKGDNEEEQKQNNIVEDEPEVYSEHEENEDEGENKEDNQQPEDDENQDANQNQEEEEEEEVKDKKKAKSQNKQSYDENTKGKKQIVSYGQAKSNPKMQSKQNQVEDQDDEDNNDSYRIQMIQKEKQKQLLDKQKYKKNLQKEDILNDVDDEEEQVNNSFEKLSISQALDQSNASQVSRGKQKQSVKPKGPYKSDVANMMSSMFSEISGFDTDI